MVTLRMFAILAGFGAAIGLWRVYRALPVENPIPWMIAALGTLMGALAGARVGYILAHPLYFSLHPQQRLLFWQGGLNDFAALAGAILLAILTTIIMRARLLPTLNLMSLMLLPVSTMIWLGLWYEGVAYGRTLPAGSVFGIPSPDEAGMLATRFPLQLVAALSLLLLLMLIEYLTKNSSPGFRFALLGLGFSTHTLIFSVFRADPVYPVAGISIDSIFSLLFAVVFALTAVILLWVARGKRDKMEYKA